MTDEEKQIENWWDKLSNSQQDWLSEKFYPNDNIDTLEKVVNSYNKLTKQDFMELLKID